MRTFSLLTAVLLGAALPCQNLVIYDPFGPGFVELPAPNPLIPGPAPPTLFYPAIPPLLPVPPGPPFGLPPGDATIDGTTGLNYYTDGFVIGTTPTIAYPPGPPAPPFPIGVIGPVLAGPVTAMALDPVAGILWLSDGLLIVGCAPIPGTPVVAPAFPSPTPPVVGLEWDGITGTLLVLDVGGVVFPLFPGGLPAGPPIVPPGPLPGPPSDVAIDKTGLPGPAGVRSIFVLAGPLVMDVTTGMPLPAPISPVPVGLAFHAFPASLPPVGVCPCPSFVHGVGTTGPMVSGNAAFGLTVTGLPPGQLVLYAFDFVWNPALPLINGVGCGFAFFLGSPTLVSGVAFAGAGGVATYPLPLLLPPGLGPIFHQSGTPCPADPLGIVLNPVMALTVSGV